MKVTLVTVGSRGDTEPYVALGAALKRAGHTVRVAACEPFREYVRSHGLPFAALGGDIKAIVGDEGRAALLGAATNPINAGQALRKYVGPLVEEAHGRLVSAVSGSDVVIGQMLVPGASACAESKGMLYLEAAYVPALPTREFANPGAPPNTRPGVVSYATHLIAEQVFWQAFRPLVNAFRERELGLGKAPFWGAPMFQTSRRPPMLFAVSPTVVKRPLDWPETAFMKGYWFLEPPLGWEPDSRLVDFLGSGKPPVYIGFGSMTVEEPEKLTRTVIEAVRKAGKRAVLSTGWGTLSEEKEGEDIFFVKDVPHGWLFPRVEAAIHHGGSGTTAAAFRAGIAQMAVPFLADQPFWGDRVEKLGVGPAPVAIGKVTVENLTRGLERLSDGAVKDRARRVGEKIRAERGVEEMVEVVERLADKHRAGKMSGMGRRLF
ncbi:MAG: glycosyltransferase family 1 protein [Polyangiaceae bacterium]|nr:glycosyltransferase family 1 protein [Polyangiaceae bacterium]